MKKQVKECDKAKEFNGKEDLKKQDRQGKF